MISAFEIYKVGIGPSSSHTVGPMKAANQFVTDLIEKKLIDSVTLMTADLYGALSLTGKGHLTDTAIIMGLAGNLPDTVDIASIPQFIKNLEETGKLFIMDGKYMVDFPLASSMKFNAKFLPLHENGMTLSAFAHGEVIYKKTYYSIGGGSIVDEENFTNKNQNLTNVPFPFSSEEELNKHCVENSLSVSNIMMKNELSFHTEAEIYAYFGNIQSVMNECIERGIKTEGFLPGPYKVPRRAYDLHRLLLSQKNLVNDPMAVLDWVNMFAFAVNEENASGGRVVTAPTNGACGIIPAVLAYYDKFVEPLAPEMALRFFLTTAAIGILYKMNASISGAEVGCQGEVGVACSMAAAGLAELCGGNVNQVFSAAEIGMEHNLGLTCDPIGGQVQVPCIERNAIAAVKAINSARMALRRTTPAKVSLDKVIKTMYETGKDMNAKYRETSQGGLAIAINKCE